MHFKTAVSRRCGPLLTLSLLAAGCSGVEVRGVVRDRDTQEPLKGATVVIGEQMTTTDGQGYYTLEAEPSEEPIRVHVVAPNHRAQTDLRPLRSDVDPTFLSFDLQRVEPEAPAQQGKVDVKVNTETERSVPAGTPRAEAQGSGPGATASAESGGARAEATAGEPKKD